MKFKRSMHRLQWQLTLSIMGASFLICFVILGIRLGNALKTYDSLNSSSMAAGIANQLMTNPRFTEMKISDLVRPEKNEDAGSPPPPPMPVVIDFGSIFRDMRVDVRMFPQSNLKLFYIDSENEVHEIIRAGYRPAMDRGSDTASEAVIEEGKELAEKADGSPLIVTENGHSSVLVPHTDRETGEKDYLFVYITDPELSAMIRVMLNSSIKEMVWMLAAVFLMSIIVGYMFSRRWTSWFTRIQATIDRWAEGDFENKITVSDISGIAEWEELAVRLNEMSKELEQVMQTRNDLAASEERNRLARDLHDNVKQQLFSINMNLGAAQVLQKKDSEQAAEKLQIAGQMARETLMDLDVLIGTMRPVVTTDASFRDELDKYLVLWQKSSGISLKYCIDDAEKITEKEISAAIYRICQEGLSNILRHSRAKNAEVRLTADEVGIDLLIRDDGEGFDVNEINSGVGLQSIRERTETMNGSFDVQSRSMGTVLRVHIPRRMSV